MLVTLEKPPVLLVKILTALLMFTTGEEKPGKIGLPVLSVDVVILIDKIKKY